MSFLENITSRRGEEIRSAFQSLNHDILRQQGYKPPTPPLTPEADVEPSVNHNNMFRSSTNPMFTSYENRAEQTNTRHAYNRIRTFSTTSVTENRFGYSSHWMNKNESCSCCSDRSTLPPRDVYPPHPHHHFERFNGSNVADSPSYAMRSKDSLTSNPAPTLLSVPLKRQFSYGPPEISNKRMRLTEHLTDPQEPPERNNGPVLEKPAEKIACQVHGILSLPGSREPRYEISKSELERRVNEPECLTKVDMISYVRLAKNSARTLLEKNDIRTNQHNKRSEHTVLSKMCEAECQVLAKGLREINFRYFPGTWFAKKSVQEISRAIPSSRQQRETLRDRIRKDEITKCVLLDIFFGLQERASDAEMKNFNRMSHTFGVANLRNHIEFLYRYLKEEIRMLESVYTEYAEHS